EAQRRRDPYAEAQDRELGIEPGALALAHVVYGLRGILHVTRGAEALQRRREHARQHGVARDRRQLLELPKVFTRITWHDHGAGVELHVAGGEQRALLPKLAEAQPREHQGPDR